MKYKVNYKFVSLVLESQIGNIKQKSTLKLWCRIENMAKSLKSGVKKQNKSFYKISYAFCENIK